VGAAPCPGGAPMAGAGGVVPPRRPTRRPSSPAAVRGDGKVVGPTTTRHTTAGRGARDRPRPPGPAGCRPHGRRARHACDAHRGQAGLLPCLTARARGLPGRSNDGFADSTCSMSVYGLILQQFPVSEKNHPAAHRRTLDQGQRCLRECRPAGATPGRPAPRVSLKPRGAHRVRGARRCLACRKGVWYDLLIRTWKAKVLVR
jgi:hypothetical protein